MALAPGTRIGPYGITGPLGVGGMGEVYRARDSRLNRDVALKVLPPVWADNPDRMARFEREAQVLATLNHPNIAHIYGIEDKALVMELVEGEDLSQRIAQGPVALDDAIPIARQIAEALEAAHEQGITHRDLKPANVKVRPDGTVKVLDFGLAKAMDSASMSSAVAALSNSPTLTSPAAMTAAGIILGTAAYMSPEQARGKAVDRRADIWAFGVVLYEMVVGRQLFQGENLTDILASVVKDQPDLTAAPNQVRRLLAACLNKDPRQRLQAVRDWTLLLDAGETTPSRGIARASRVLWLVTGTLGVLLAGLALVHFREMPPDERLLQVSVPLPANSSVGFLDLSPDGRRLVVSATQDGKSQLQLRSLDAVDWQPLSGTDNARAPFWSPDSRFIGFFADGKLKVMPAAGGPARELCAETNLGAGGTWSSRGVILFASSGGRSLRRVDAAGGACTEVNLPNRASTFPVFLPDGNHFVYQGGRTQSDSGSAGIYLGALDNLAPRRLLGDNSSAIYSPPVAGNGHLLFLRDHALMAQPFDEAKLEVVGDPFPIASDATASFTAPQVAASVAHGTLVYVAGRQTVSQMTWFDRTGKELGRVGPRADQSRVVLSPDGNALLTRRLESNGQGTLWLYDLARASEDHRFLPVGKGGDAPIWFPLGRRVLFNMRGASGPALYQKDTASGGQEEPAFPRDFPGPGQFYASAFSKDGRFLIYTIVDPKTQADIWYVPWSDTPDPGARVKFLATDAAESQGQLSPDGKWIAYTSNETGDYEVYVRPFPTGSGVSKASVDGGREPRWSEDGKQLYFVRYLTPERRTLVATTAQPDGRGGLQMGTPQKLFDQRSRSTVPQFNDFNYSPHPDGQRFLVNALVDESESTINLVINWQRAVAK